MPFEHDDDDIFKKWNFFLQKGQSKAPKMKKNTHNHANTHPPIHLQTFTFEFKVRKSSHSAIDFINMKKTCRVFNLAVVGQFRFHHEAIFLYLIFNSLFLPSPCNLTTTATVELNRVYI